MAMTKSATKTAALPVLLRGLDCYYGSRHALKNIHLNIQKGEFLTLLGPSGSGKTSLLMAIAGFQKLHRGQIFFGEEDVTSKKSHRRNIGMVFQNYALFPNMNVENNIKFPLKMRNIKGQDSKTRDILNITQLGECNSRTVFSLSGGEKQRVALARAIVSNPPILLMDEPLASLDKNLREQMQIYIRRLHQRLDTTIVYVTHDQREALAISSRIAIMNEGEIIQTDTPQRIYQNPVNKFVANFIGESSCLPVSFKNGAIFCNEKPVKTAQMPENTHHPHVLMVRPEKLRIVDQNARQNETENSDKNLFPATVRETIFQGDSLLITIALENGSEAGVRVLSSHSAMKKFPEQGEKLTVALHKEDSLIIPC